jgi:DNA-directed RNA polymerase subunit alpha
METETLLNQRLDEQDLTVRTLACLRAAGIETVRELVRLQKTDFLAFRSVGRKVFIELDDFLADNKLSWGMKV